MSVLKNIKNKKISSIVQSVKHHKIQKEIDIVVGSPEEEWEKYKNENILELIPYLTPKAYVLIKKAFLDGAKLYY